MVSLERLSRINSYFVDRYIIKNRSSWILPAQLLFGPLQLNFGQNGRTEQYYLKNGLDLIQIPS